MARYSREALLQHRVLSCDAPASLLLVLDQDTVAQRLFALRQGGNAVHEALRRKRIVAILNKATPDNLETLVKKIVAETGADAQLAGELPELLHTRALAGECYIRTYAQLAKALAPRLKGFAEALLQFCKAEFVRMDSKHMLANVSFVGHLVTIKAFPPSCIDGILMQLVRDQEPEAQRVSVACALWTIGGTFLSAQQQQRYLGVWRRLQQLLLRGI